MNKQKNIKYFDFASSTPVDPRVVEAMDPYWTEEFGNPGSLHYFGQRAMGAVDLAREVLANILDIDFREIIFTGGATEANNLAIQGAVKYAKDKVGIQKPKIIISAVEHDSVSMTAKMLESSGVAELEIIPVNSQGIVDTEILKNALTKETAIVSLIYVQNETGAKQPIKEVADIVRDFRGDNMFPLLHTDAVQAFQYFSCSPKEIGVDMLTLSAHKIYGPKGAGVLYIKKNNPASILPILAGGGQEFGFRPGTENVPLVVGLAEAVKIAYKERVSRLDHVIDIYKYFIDKLNQEYPNANVNGPDTLKDRSPHVVNIRLPGVLAEEAVMRLDLQGIAISSGSACHTRAHRPSEVLSAMKIGEEVAKESLRISFGAGTSKKDVDYLVSALASLQTT